MNAFRDGRKRSCPCKQISKLPRLLHVVLTEDSKGTPIKSARSIVYQSVCSLKDVCLFIGEVLLVDSKTPFAVDIDPRQ